MAAPVRHVHVPVVSPHGLVLASFLLDVHRAGDSTEWTEYAMHLPKNVIEHVVGENGNHLMELQRNSGCKMWVAREILREKESTFLGKRRHSSLLFRLHSRAMQCFCADPRVSLRMPA